MVLDKTIETYDEIVKEMERYIQEHWEIFESYLTLKNTAIELREKIKKEMEENAPTTGAKQFADGYSVTTRTRSVISAKKLISEFADIVLKHPELCTVNVTELKRLLPQHPELARIVESSSYVVCNIKKIPEI